MFENQPSIIGNALWHHMEAFWHMDWINKFKTVKISFLSLEAKWGRGKLCRMHLCEIILSNSHATQLVGFLTGREFLTAANFTAVNKMMNQNVEYAYSLHLIYTYAIVAMVLLFSHSTVRFFFYTFICYRSHWIFPSDNIPAWLVTS